MQLEPLHSSLLTGVNDDAAARSITTSLLGRAACIVLHSSRVDSGRGMGGRCLIFLSLDVLVARGASDPVQPCSALRWLLLLFDKRGTPTAILR